MNALMRCLENPRARAVGLAAIFGSAWHCMGAGVAEQFASATAIWTAWHWLPAGIVAGLAAGAFCLWRGSRSGILRELVLTAATLEIGVMTYFLVGGALEHFFGPPSDFRLLEFWAMVPVLMLGVLYPPLAIVWIAFAGLTRMLYFRLLRIEPTPAARG